MYTASHVLHNPCIYFETFHVIQGIFIGYRDIILIIIAMLLLSCIVFDERWQRSGLQVNRSSDRACNWGMIPKLLISLRLSPTHYNRTAQNLGLKHHSFVVLVLVGLCLYQNSFSLASLVSIYMLVALSRVTRHNPLSLPPTHTHTQNTPPPQPLSNIIILEWP